MGVTNFTGGGVEAILRSNLLLRILCVFRCHKQALMLAAMLCNSGWSSVALGNSIIVSPESISFEAMVMEAVTFQIEVSESEVDGPMDLRASGLRIQREIKRRIGGGQHSSWSPTHKR